MHHTHSLIYPQRPQLPKLQPMSPTIVNIKQLEAEAEILEYREAYDNVVQNMKKMETVKAKEALKESRKGLRKILEHKKVEQSESLTRLAKMR